MLTFYPSEQCGKALKQIEYISSEMQIKINFFSRSHNSRGEIIYPFLFFFIDYSAEQ
jgi:hypothetical protein